MAHLAEPARGEQLAVQRSQPPHIAAAHHRHVGRPVAVAGGDRERAVARDAEAAAGIGPVELGSGQPFSDIADRAVETDAGDPGAAAIVILDVDGPSVRRPDGVGDAAIERGGERPGARTVRVHHIEQVVLIGPLVIVIAGIGDQPAVGGGRGLAVRTVAAGQRGDPRGCHVERIDFGIGGIALPVFVTIGAEQDGASVRRPREGAAVTIGAVAQLARRASIRGDDENLIVTRLQIAAAVKPVDDGVDHLEIIGPASAFGTGLRRAKPRRIIGHEHRIGDLASVGRPGDRARRFGQAGDPRGFAIGHPADIKLRLAALGRGHISEAVAGRGPVRLARRAGAGGDRHLSPALRVDQPDRRPVSVGHDVARMADIGDPPPVGADLRIARGLQVEQVARRETRVGAGGGRRGQTRRPGQRKRAGQDCFLHDCASPFSITF